MRRLVQENAVRFLRLSSRSSELSERSIRLTVVSHKLLERSRTIRKRLGDLKTTFQERLLEPIKAPPEAYRERTGQW